VPLTSDGKFRIRVDSANTINLIADIQGYYTPASLNGFSPTNGSLLNVTSIAAGQTLTVPVGGVLGMPTSAGGLDSVALNLVVTGSSAAGGTIRAWADGSAEPTGTSTMVYPMGGGALTSNLAMVPVGASNKIRIHNVSSAPISLAVQVQGFNAINKSISGCDFGTPDDVRKLTELRNWNEKAGVDWATNNALVDKIQACEMWDSVRQGQAVSTTTTVVDGLPTKVAIYPDGSRAYLGSATSDSAGGSLDALSTAAIVDKLKPDSAELTTQSGGSFNASVSECQGMGFVNEWGHGDNCYVFYSSGLITLSYRASFTLVNPATSSYNGGVSSIDSLSDEAAFIVLAEVVDEDLSKTHPVSIGSIPAEGRYRVKAKFQLITLDVWLKLKVIWNEAYVEVGL
jgi:hypothetical protein